MESATRQVMGTASKIVLRGFEIRTDVKIVRFPDRYMDERGGGMWATVQHLLEGLALQHT